MAHTSGPRDYLVGRGGQREIHPALLIGAHSGGKVEVGKQDLLCPVAVRPIGTRNIECRANNGVAGNILSVSIAKNKHHGRKLVALTGSQLDGAACHRGIDVIAGEADKAVALQLNEQRTGGFHFLDGLRRRLLHNDRSGGWLHHLLPTIGIVAVVPPVGGAPEGRDEAVVAKTTMVKAADNAGPDMANAEARAMA